MLTDSEWVRQMSCKRVIHIEKIIRQDVMCCNDVHYMPGCFANLCITSCHAQEGSSRINNEWQHVGGLLLCSLSY